MTWLENGFGEIERRKLGEISKAIRQCRRLDLFNSSIGYIQECVAAAISGYAKNVQIIDLGKHPIYRAQRCRDGNSKTNKSQLWYNPNLGQIGFGRANNPGQQILYLASDVYVSTLEVRPKVGELVNIIECSPKGSTTQFSFLDFLVFDEDVLPKMKWNLHGAKIDLERALGRNNFLKNQMILEFISSEFRRIVERNEEYKITASLCNLLWFDEENDDAVIYPSIAANYNGFNIALKPEVADHRIKVNKVLEFRVIDIVSGIPQIDLIKEGVCDEGNGNIKWGKG